MNYQLTLVLKNDLKDSDRDEIISETKKKFAKLKKEDLWGARNLAYQIDHNDKGYYAFFEFESEPKNIPPLDKSLRLNEDILRYLIVKV